MKKTTKGALAAGAAAVLLAGGAGTYAAWTATPDAATGDTVSTGHLTIEQQDTAWTWATPGVNGDFDPDTMTLAPGDSIRFEGTYVLGIEGTNLTATLQATSGASGTLPDGLTWTADTGNTLTGLDESNDGDEVTVGGTLAFAGTETGSMDEDIALGDIAVTLKQTAPAVAP